MTFKLKELQKKKWGSEERRKDKKDLHIVVDFKEAELMKVTSLSSFPNIVPFPPLLGYFNE